MTTPPPLPRVVEIGLNLISIHEVSDNQHTFEGNVLYHLFWDCLPLDPTKAPFFRPWIQVHNIREMRQIKNDGMVQLRSADLVKKVKNHMAEHRGKPVIPPCKVFENHNFVGQFVSLLDLKNFPFDEQALRITILCNPTSQVTFTQRVVRDAQGLPKIMPNGAPMRSIKCNLEEDTLSEWEVLLSNGGHMEGSFLAAPRPALSSYEFKEHDPAYSAEGQVYQRLDFYVYVFRSVSSIMFSVILPSVLLTLACFSIFSLDVVDHNNDRFAILFTVILTLVANQFVVGGRLPHLAYLTWVDWTLLSMQLFVYSLVLQNSICADAANLAGNMTPQEADLISLWVFIAVYLMLLLTYVLTGMRLLRQRSNRTREVSIKAHQSFEKEEARFQAIRSGNGRVPVAGPAVPATAPSSSASGTTASSRVQDNTSLSVKV